MADFLGMMKQAAQLQSKMQAMQEELGNLEVDGISGGGLVAVRMTAKMEVKGVKIDPSLMKPKSARCSRISWSPRITMRGARRKPRRWKRCSR